MKIAILYSGYIRNLVETISNNLEHFYYDDSDIDLYFSIWDKVGYADRINSPDFIQATRILNSDTEITKELIIDLVLKHGNVNIKNIKIEKREEKICKLDLINGIDNPGLPGQFYKILDCFNLIDNSINYDAIVRLRCDIKIYNKPDKNYLLDIMQNNKILFNEKIWYNHPRLPHHTDINDMIWIANKNVMKKACNIYNNVDKINEIIKNNNQKYANFGENITFMNLIVENISNNIELFDFDFRILR